jgi:hypothetical protein
MKKVNALKVRNQFGEVLEMLEAEGEPILIEKKKEVRAVLISYEDFQTRFIDKQAEEEKRKFFDQIRSHAAPSITEETSLSTLRRFRGYDG